MAPMALTDRVVTRNGFWIGFVAVLQTVVPALVAVAFLYYLVSMFDAALAQYFNAMAVLDRRRGELAPRVFHSGSSLSFALMSHSATSIAAIAALS